MRLTKKRLDALNTAISVDEVLYEKFRRLHQEVQREWEKIWRAKTVVEVVEHDSSIYRQMEILRVEPTADGTRVIVRALKPANGDNKS